MLVPSMYDMAEVMTQSGYSEEQVFDCGISGQIAFVVVVPEIGACYVPLVALSHFMAGADEYTADGMLAHWSGQPSGPWTIKRDRLRILADSWEEHAERCHILADALERQQLDDEAATLRTPPRTRMKPVPPRGTTIADKSPDALASPRVMHGHRVWRLSEAIDEIAKALGWHSSQRDHLMTQAVKDATACDLKVRDLYADGIIKKGDHMSELLDSVFSSDVNEWLDKIGAPFEYRLPEAEPPGPESVSSEEIDFAMLATRQQLIEAFGISTGMDDSWFKNLKDAPKLLAARKFPGVGGHNSIEPFFCPYEVMLWLVDTKRKKGRRLSSDRAWQLLQNNFLKVYNQYSIGDTRSD